MRIVRSHLVLPLLFLVGGNCLGQSNLNWFAVTPVPIDVYASAAYDVARQQAVLFTTTGETWLWDGTAWSKKSPVHSPPQRWMAVMAFDYYQSRVLLYGGTWGNTSFTDTWEWTGTDWLVMSPAAHPFNSVGKIANYGSSVVFYGDSFDIWTWNGSNWVRLTPDNIPWPIRQATSMADASSDLMLFGGLINGTTSLNDTWLWDGTNWAQKTIATPPPARYFASMSRGPRGQVVLFGGESFQSGQGGGYSVYNDTWVWGGTSWAQQSPPISPSGRWGFPFVYDSAGNISLLLGPDVWSWDGSRWWPTDVFPSARGFHSMAYNGNDGSVLLFGGTTGGGNYLGDTWVWNGSNWLQKSPVHSPPAGIYGCMAYDAQRQQIVLFGSWTGTDVVTNDTWTWDGNDWTLQSPTNRPPARHGAAMAYDVARGQVVLFGGFGNGVILNDTWAWDGLNWTQGTPATAPPPRAYHSMAYDPVNREIAAFGGEDASLNVTNETWIWNGTTWQQRFPPNSPAPRRFPALAFHSGLAAITLVGGLGSSQAPLSDLWLWNGSNWQQQLTTTPTPAIHGTGLAGIPQSGRLVMFGGYDGTKYLATTQTLAGAGSHSTLQIMTSPSSLIVTVDGLPYSAPQSYTLPTGTIHIIGVPSPQGTYAFNNWSDGGSQTHAIILPSSDSALTASFVALPAETASTPSTPSGTTSGTTGVCYSYSTGGASSNLGHSVQYYFDWGDGSNSGWLAVGVISASHSWSSAGTYTVKAMARCATHTSVQSAWSSGLTVNMTTAGPGRTPTAVFRDTNNSIRLTRQGTATLYNGGGVFAGDPSSSQNANGDTFVVARDNSNALWAGVFNANTLSWGSWTYGAGITKGVPALAVAASGTAYIAARDNWNSYWLTSYTQGGGFGSWTYLAGIFSTDPVMAACGDGSMYIVGRDNWRSLWSGRYVPGSGFQGWQYGGGIIQGNPAVTCGTDNTVYVAVRDDWNSLWMARVQGNSWLGWSYGGGIMNGDPQAAAGGNGTIYTVLRDSGGVVWYRGYTEGTSGGWQSWVMTGGMLQSVAPAANAGDLYIAGRDGKNDLWWYRATGNQWTNIGNRGIAAGPLAAVPR